MTTRLFADVTVSNDYSVDVLTNIAGIRNALHGAAELFNAIEFCGDYYLSYQCNSYAHALEVEQIVLDCLTCERLLANVEVVL